MKIYKRAERLFGTLEYRLCKVAIIPNSMTLQSSFFMIAAVQLLKHTSTWNFGQTLEKNLKSSNAQSLIH